MKGVALMEIKSCRKLPCGRSVEPAETIRRLEQVIGRKHDYLLHEEQVSDLLYWAALFIDDLQFRAMGKGINAEQSRAGALAEAAEWLTGLDTARLPGYMVAHQDDLEPGSFLPVEDLLAHVSTATPPVLENIKDLDEARFWVDGWSLTRERTIKVPIEYVSLIGGPNGKAAGNTIEEAIEHAALEIFERRVHITVLRNSLVMPTIDPGTITDPLLRHQMDFIRGKGIEVILKDLSFGGALPCVGAYFIDPAVPDDYQFHHFFKVGASFNTTEALMRTFTEFVQGRMHDEFIGGSKAEQERLLRHDFRSLRVVDSPCDNFLSAFMFGFMPCREGSFLREGDRVPFDPGPSYRDSRDDIQAALRVCRTLGKDMIVVDYTDPEIGFAVVQVVIPGYSDVLPFHPAGSPGLFRRLTRSDVLEMYAHGC
jgi:ribosomal protein S12 methylthiotransferase accessory factor YcaO